MRFVAGVPYTKRTAPLLDQPAAIKALGGPIGWLSTEFGNVARAMAFPACPVVTEDYDAKPGDGLILANATPDPITITLPDATANPNIVLIVKRTNGGANVVTVEGTVDGTTDPTLGSQWASITVLSTGGSWYQIAST